MKLQRYAEMFFDEIVLVFLICFFIIVWWITKEARILEMFSFGAFTALLGLLKGKRGMQRNQSPDEQDAD